MSAIAVPLGASGARRARRPDPWLLWGIAVAGVALAVGLKLWMPHAPPYVGLEAHVQSLVLVLAGVVAWARRPEYRVGKIMVLAGAAWFFKILTFAPNSLAFTLSYTWQDFYDPLLAYLALSFPAGRLTRGQAWFFWPYVLVMYVLWWPVTALLSARHIPAPPFPGIHMHTTNLLSVHDLHVSAPAQYIGAPSWFVHSGAAFLTVVVGLTLARWLRASRPEKRMLAPALTPAIFTMSVTIVFYTMLNVVNADSKALSSIVTLLQRVGSWSWFALPVGFLAGLYLEQHAQARVGRLVVELDELPGLGGLEESLRRALHDPSLRVGFYDRDSGTYRTAGGAPLDIDEDAANLVATRLERAGMPLGLMVHDRALLENPQLMEATAAAVRMAVDNDRLNAAVRAQLEEVRASRARIVEASDTERRRIERNLHDGAQQRLVSLAMSLRVAQTNAEKSGDPALVDELARSAEALERAIAELRELAQGIHPAVLTDEGLRYALEELAESSMLPVRLAIDDARFPAPVEATAYFLVSEALANATKHARASVVSVDIHHANERLLVEVTDDGAGGADLGKGSGLPGLQDRVAALGGTLSVESPSGRGTRLMAEIPCALRSPTTPS
jgi:signal transduction histidine kinase